MSVRVSNLTARDIPDVLSISVECGLCIWSPEAYRSELVREDTIMLKLADEQDVIIGFAVGRLFNLSPSDHTVELTNIGLRKAFRSHGFGSLLFKSFLNHCVSVGASTVVLEVRESNATAIRFYEKFGFHAAGRRRRFYSKPPEDAITMRLVLDPSTALKIHT